MNKNNIILIIFLIVVFFISGFVQLKINESHVNDIKKQLHTNCIEQNGTFVHDGNKCTYGDEENTKYHLGISCSKNNFQFKVFLHSNSSINMQLPKMYADNCIIVTETDD